MGIMPITAKRCFVIAGTLLFLFCSGIPALAAEAMEQDANALEEMRTEIAKMDTVKEVNVYFGFSGLIYSPSGEKTFMNRYMAVAVILDQPPTPKMEVKIARIILRQYPLVEKYDFFSVQLIPINSMYSFNYNGSSNYWKDQIAKMENND